ncbi:MAG TPA: transposase [Burkholderiales bacterium]|nr:transposase [Burkholderiales bacterium]
MFHSTGGDEAVSYQLDLGTPIDGQAVGTSAHAGLASFLRFVQRAGVESVLHQAVRLPVQERRTGFTQAQKSLALLAALAAVARSARDSDFTLAADPVAVRVLGLPRWPHSSQLTRHLKAFRPQHVHALRRAVEDLTASQATTRRRLRRGERVVVDLDQTAISANGRTYERTARGHFPKKGARGYQATAVFAGDTGGGDDEVLAIFLDPGNAHATWRFADALAALERVLGPLDRLPGLILRFDCQYATADDLALLLRRRIRFVGRVYADATAAGWALEHRTALHWEELSPVKWVADLGEGPIAPRHPELVCRRLLVRSTGARHRCGYTAILTYLAPAELPTADLEPFYEARQTIEGWLSEATDALQLKGLWSRSFAGLEAFLLHAALASNLLNWWERRDLRPASDLPHLGLRQLIGRVIRLPARIVQTATDHLVLLLPPTHCYARRLVPPGRSWQLPLPFDHFVLCDAHF